MKKILIVHPALVMGGAETVLLNIVQILSKNKNYDIELFFMENRDNYNYHLIPDNVKVDYALTGLETSYFIYMKNVVHHQAFHFKSKEFYQSWIAGCQNKVKHRLAEKLTTTHYDVVIDFQRNYTSMDEYLENHSFPEKTKSMRWIHSEYELKRFDAAPAYFGNILQKYTKVICICEEMQQHATQYLSSHQINTTNLDYIFNPQAQESILEKMNDRLSDEDEKLMLDDYIVQVSRLEEHQKNHLQLLDIYAKLKQKGIREKLYIIGGGDNTHLRQKIQALNLENDCLLLGARNNPFPFMKNAKLFLHTAKFEGFGMVLTESMICGTPVVAFGCPTGPSEILGDGKYGELIPFENNQGDEELFVEKTYALLNNPERINEFKTLLPESVARFNFDAVSKKLFAIIDEITQEE